MTYRCVIHFDQFIFIFYDCNKEMIIFRGNLQYYAYFKIHNPLKTFLKSNFWFYKMKLYTVYNSDFIVNRYHSIKSAYSNTVSFKFHSNNMPYP